MFPVLGRPSIATGRVALSLAALLTLRTESASAGPEVGLRVRGTSRIEASAGTSSGSLILKGAVLEDNGRPVPGALVRVRRATRAGSPGSLGPAEPCSASDAPTLEPSQGQDVLARADAAGRFCLRWEKDPPAGRLSLTFQDKRGLLEPTEQWLDAKPVTPFEIAFSRIERSVSLDEPEVSLELTSHVHPGSPSRELPLQVLWVRTGAPSVTLSSRALRVGEKVKLSFPSRMLASPGPGEFRARFGEGTQVAEARAPVVVTVRARLHVPKTLSVRSGGEGSLRVQVESAVGALDSGFVEAQIGESTVGIAEVSKGRAELPLVLGQGPLRQTVGVRYLPATPWWIAGPPASVLVEVAGASAWRTLLWAAGLLAIAVYVATSWRRPARSSVRLGAAISPAGATLQWRPPPKKHQDGWVGTVLDAHDHSPIGGALVLALFPGGVERRTVTQPDGSFELHAPMLSHRGARLRIESAWHSSYEGELPARGLISVELVTRRRALLARLVNWTRRRGSPWGGAAEPTPAELARSAEAHAQAEVAYWAREVEAAAFGPKAVDREEEARVRALEPDPKA